eukprot:12913392-Prorocentrum_lima.AAC.1
MDIARERSLAETPLDRDVDAGASSSATPVVKRWSRPTAAKRTPARQPEPKLVAATGIAASAAGGGEGEARRTVDSKQPHRRVLPEKGRRV